MTVFFDEFYWLPINFGKFQATFPQQNERFREDSNSVVWLKLHGHQLTFKTELF